MPRLWRPGRRPPWPSEASTVGRRRWISSSRPSAEVHGAVLLHYDRHFDLIARVTGQPTEWLARRGSLD